MAFDYINWILIPFAIFVARIMDVSLGTIRVITMSKGLRTLPSLIGFIEVGIWIIAVRQIMTSTDNPIWFAAYAAGFAAGTYIGIVLTDKLSFGNAIVRVITKTKATNLINDLIDKGFGVTVTETDNKTSKGQLIFSIIRTKDADEIIKLIKKHNPKAFYSLEEIKHVSNSAIFPTRRKRAFKNPFNHGLGMIHRKSK